MTYYHFDIAALAMQPSQKIPSLKFWGYVQTNRMYSEGKGFVSIFSTYWGALTLPTPPVLPTLSKIPTYIHMYF